jgi:hypothetical protein
MYSPILFVPYSPIATGGEEEYADEDAFNPNMS